MCVCVCICACVGASAHRVQKKELDALKLNPQVVMIHLIVVLKIEFWVL